MLRTTASRDDMSPDRGGRLAGDRSTGGAGGWGRSAFVGRLWAGGGAGGRLWLGPCPPRGRGVGADYWGVTKGGPAGSALLLIFAGALGVYTWVLMPTTETVGPTAPVDPDFEPERH